MLKYTISEKYYKAQIYETTLHIQGQPSGTSQLQALSCNNYHVLLQLLTIYRL